MKKLTSAILLAAALSIGACAKHDAADNNTADTVSDNSAAGDNLASANDSGLADNATDNTAGLEAGNASNLSQ